MLSLSKCGFSSSNAKAINVLTTSKIPFHLQHRQIEDSYVFLVIQQQNLNKKNQVLQNYGDSSDINVTKQLRESSRKSPFTESNHPYHNHIIK